MMKNWEPAELGLMALARESTPGGVLQGIEHAVLGKFSFNAVAGASHSGALRASALDHKAADYPVENQTVVKAFLNQADKLLTEMGAISG